MMDKTPVFNRLVNRPPNFQRIQSFQLDPFESTSTTIHSTLQKLFQACFQLKQQALYEPAHTIRPQFHMLQKVSQKLLNQLESLSGNTHNLVSSYSQSPAQLAHMNSVVQSLLSISGRISTLLSEILQIITPYPISFHVPSASSYIFQPSGNQLSKPNIIPPKALKPIFLPVQSSTEESEESEESEENESFFIENQQMYKVLGSQMDQLEKVSESIILISNLTNQLGSRLETQELLIDQIHTNTKASTKNSENAKRQLVSVQNRTSLGKYWFFFVLICLSLVLIYIDIKSDTFSRDFHTLNNFVQQLKDHGVLFQGFIQSESQVDLADGNIENVNDDDKTHESISLDSKILSSDTANPAKKPSEYDPSLNENDFKSATENSNSLKEESIQGDIIDSIIDTSVTFIEEISQETFNSHFKEEEDELLAEHSISPKNLSNQPIRISNEASDEDSSSTSKNQPIDIENVQESSFSFSGVRSMGSFDSEEEE